MVCTSNSPSLPEMSHGSVSIPLKVLIVSLLVRLKSIFLYTGILSLSCFMWSAALDSSGVLVPYSIILLVLHITTILIPALF